MVHHKAVHGDKATAAGCQLCYVILPLRGCLRVEKYKTGVTCLGRKVFLNYAGDALAADVRALWTAEQRNKFADVFLAVAYAS